MRQHVCLTLSLCLGLTLAGYDSAAGRDDTLNFVLTARTLAATQKPSGEGLEVSLVKNLLKKIRLHEIASDDSADIQDGPWAVVLNPDGTRTDVALSSIPEGSYDRIRLRLHKPEDMEPIPDAEFRSGASGRERHSVIVRGMWNGMPFTYRSRQSAEQEEERTPPLRVASGTIVAATLLIDPRTWFEGPDGTLDLTLEQNAQLVDDRITQSFSRTGTGNGG
jgi:hypothetical protein